MLRNDGEYIIFKLQHQKKTSSAKWYYSNLDEFFVEGIEYKSFLAGGMCWQETGSYGTYSIETARIVRDKMIEKYGSEYRFRLTEVRITQITVIVL